MSWLFEAGQPTRRTHCSAICSPGMRSTLRWQGRPVLLLVFYTNASFMCRLSYSLHMRSGSTLQVAGGAPSSRRQASRHNSARLDLIMRTRGILCLTVRTRSRTGRNSCIDPGSQLSLKYTMTTACRTRRYIFLLSVFILIFQVAVAVGQNKNRGVTVSYESLGSSRVARFRNSNTYPVRIEFSYQGTRVHGSAEASGQDAVSVAAEFSATYGGNGLSITSVRITGVMRSD